MEIGENPRYFSTGKWETVTKQSMNMCKKLFSYTLKKIEFQCRNSSGWWTYKLGK